MVKSISTTRVAGCHPQRADADRSDVTSPANGENPHKIYPSCGVRDDSKMIKVRQRQDRNTPQRLASPQTAPSNKVDPAPSEAYHLGWPRTPELGDLRAPTRAARTAVSRTDSAIRRDVQDCRGDLA